jgi:hypothetical protein
MTDFEQIPPDLAGIDEQLAAHRPVADGDTLDRVMTRTQRARSDRRSWLRPQGAPRSNRRILAVTAATLFTMAGTTGLAAAVMGVSTKDAVSTLSTSSSSESNASSKQYCPASSPNAGATPPDCGQGNSNGKGNGKGNGGSRP